jgi:hypothetical protein
MTGDGIDEYLIMDETGGELYEYLTEVVLR